MRSAYVFDDEAFRPLRFAPASGYPPGVRRELRGPTREFALILMRMLEPVQRLREAVNGDADAAAQLMADYGDVVQDQVELVLKERFGHCSRALRNKLAELIWKERIFCASFLSRVEVNLSAEFKGLTFEAFLEQEADNAEELLNHIRTDPS